MDSEQDIILDGDVTGTCTSVDINRTLDSEVSWRASVLETPDLVCSLYIISALVCERRSNNAYQIGDKDFTLVLKRHVRVREPTLVEGYNRRVSSERQRVLGGRRSKNSVLSTVLDAYRLDS